jgi:SAM-dependent methyltransferase
MKCIWRLQGGLKLPQEKNGEKSEKTPNSIELEVRMANLNAWNYWGRLWAQTSVNKPFDPNTLHLMKTRTLTYQRAYQKIIFSIGGFARKSVLDIGCGVSEYHNWLASDSQRYVGVDISVEMLKLSRKEMSTSVELIAADAMHLPFKDDAFNISITFQALHHFPNWEKALDEMIRTSNQIVLYEPNGDSLFHRIMHFLRRTFRVEQRFKESNEDYELVEFHASGFSSMKLTNFLNQKDMKTSLFWLSLVPVSMLAKASSTSLLLMSVILTVEDLLGKIPIFRKQLGDILVTACKAKCMSNPTNF